ncbi:MAG: hypothetical protein ACXAB2_14620 [Candidatus Hodarchaeales archaeon]
MASEGFFIIIFGFGLLILSLVLHAVRTKDYSVFTKFSPDTETFTPVELWMNRIGLVAAIIGFLLFFLID